MELTVSKTYLCGLDLGKQRDFTVLSIVERDESWPPGTLPMDRDTTKKISTYSVRHLQRWALGTNYVTIVKDLAKLLERPPLPGCKLVVDATGVGGAVIDQIRVAIKNGLDAQLVPITLTGGTRAKGVAGGWHLPKQEVVGVLQVLLQQERLKIADLPERDPVEGVPDLPHQAQGRHGQRHLRGVARVRP
jgi:hypothetical protein